MSPHIDLLSDLFSLEKHGLHGADLSYFVLILFCMRSQCQKSYNSKGNKLMSQ